MSTKTPNAKPVEEQKYPLDKLAQNARALFGVSTVYFAGATSGLKGEYTINETKTLLDEWGKKEVK